MIRIILIIYIYIYISKLLFGRDILKSTQIFLLDWVVTIVTCVCLSSCTRTFHAVTLGIISRYGPDVPTGVFAKILWLKLEKCCRENDAIMISLTYLVNNDYL